MAVQSQLQACNSYSCFQCSGKQNLIAKEEVASQPRLVLATTVNLPFADPVTQIFDPFTSFNSFFFFAASIATFL